MAPASATTRPFSLPWSWFESLLFFSSRRSTYSRFGYLLGYTYYCQYAVSRSFTTSKIYRNTKNKIVGYTLCLQLQSKLKSLKSQQNGQSVSGHWSVWSGQCYSGHLPTTEYFVAQTTPTNFNLFMSQSIFFWISYILCHVHKFARVARLAYRLVTRWVTRRARCEWSLVNGHSSSRSPRPQSHYLWMRIPTV